MSSWTKSEIEWLKVNYPIRGKTHSSNHLDRSIGSIANKASVLGLKLDPISEFKKAAWEKAALSRIGRKRPEHSRKMKEIARERGGLHFQNPEVLTIHGLSRTKAYSIWYGMMNRCYKPNIRSYRFYGARGITVCDEWKNVEIFTEWFNKNYSEGLTIERVDYNKGYSPENCTFIIPAAQARNRRSTKINIEIARKIRTLYTKGLSQMEITRELHLPLHTIHEVVRGKTWKDF
jgi:hypothetical protein